MRFHEYVSTNKDMNFNSSHSKCTTNENEIVDGSEARHIGTICSVACNVGHELADETNWLRCIDRSGAGQWSGASCVKGVTFVTSLSSSLGNLLL